MCAKWFQSCPTLCDPVDYIVCQAPLSMGSLQGRMLRWVAMPFSRGSSWHKDSTLSQWTWVWVNYESWWWTGRLGMLWFMGSQRVGNDWVTELNWTECPCMPLSLEIFFALNSTLSNINICFYPFIFQVFMPLLSFLGFPGGSDSKESTCLVKTWMQLLGSEDPLEEDMGICILAWRIPWIEESCGL